MLPRCEPPAGLHIFPGLEVRVLGWDQSAGLSLPGIQGRAQGGDAIGVLPCQILRLPGILYEVKKLYVLILKKVDELPVAVTNAGAGTPPPSGPRESSPRLDAPSSTTS